jgi:UDP-N-acetyl-D-galactosamine dehydrogenase
MQELSPRIAVIGLGYVGLPLALALARKFETHGVDVDKGRIAELRAGHDRTGEIEAPVLSASPITLHEAVDAAPPCDFYIVTVPTPIDGQNRPDLDLVVRASRSVGAVLAAAVSEGRRPVVVYESTVYPGVTEDICAPVLEEVSGHKCGEDFFLAYSPERINPGDREHTVDKITKVVSGQTPVVLHRVAAIYGAVTSGGVFRASSIKVAEAAKVIENAQRDINIAFMNEIAQIFSRIGISTWDVLEAAGTKWNFLPFTPGLVGGHCIGIDPYYLAHRARELGIEPNVITAGRGINDSMAEWVAGELHAARSGKGGSALVLGLTFKEDIPDLRNSKVADLAAALGKLGHAVTIHDPMADPGEAQHEYGVSLAPGLPAGPFDLVLLAVPHAEYRALGHDALRAMLSEGGTLADLKGVLGGKADWSL